MNMNVDNWELYDLYNYLTENLSTNNAKLWIYNSLDSIVELMK